MKKIVIDNYDGEKGYLGSLKLYAVKIKGNTYLVDWDEMGNPKGRVTFTPSAAFKVVSVDDSLQTASARKVTDKGTLARVAQVLEEGLNAEVAPSVQDSLTTIFRKMFNTS